MKLNLDKFSEYPEWIKDILISEEKYHQDFFGRVFDLTEFAATLRGYGEEKLKLWKKIKLEPHFLPKVLMMHSDSYPGWKVRLSRWFYEDLIDGNLFRDTNNRFNEIEKKMERAEYLIYHTDYTFHIRELSRFAEEIKDELQRVSLIALEGISVLIDSRRQPTFHPRVQKWENTNDNFPWEDDELFFGRIVKKLRKNGKISNYELRPKPCPISSSRFHISREEWESEVKPALATLLDLSVNQVRLETMLEGIVIPQIYNDMPREMDISNLTPRGGHADYTNVLREEYVLKNRYFQCMFSIAGYDDNELSGGHRDHLGCCSFDSNDRWIAPRAIAVL